MKIVIIILARKGSKRIKNKNLLLVNKKPLILHTIEFAKKITSRNRVILFSDDEKIINIGRKKGVFTSIQRPKKISTDNVSSAKTSLYALRKYDEKNKSKFDIVALLQPTTPYRKISTFKNCLREFKKNINIPLVSVAKIKKNISKDFKLYCLRKIANQSTNLNIRKKIKFETNTYFNFVNGSFYFIRYKILKNKKNFITNNFRGYNLTSSKENIDIDTWDDVKLAKKIL